MLKTGLCALARQFCKSGCPVAHRRELWCRALAVDPTLPEVCTALNIQSEHRMESNLQLNCEEEGIGRAGERDSVIEGQGWTWKEGEMERRRKRVC